MSKLRYFMFKMREIRQFIHKITDFQHFPPLNSKFFIRKVHYFGKNS